MFNTWQTFLIIGITVAASLLFMWILNRVWPWEKRQDHNDLIGWELNVLGTTYAVILGFMLYTVWTNYGAAKLNAESEANALGNLYRVAAGLPAEPRASVVELTRNYAETVIDEDWPVMAADHVPEASHKLNQEMWKTLMAVKTDSLSEITAEDHAITELSSMTEHRRIRLLQNSFRLPIVLWCVLLVGAVATIASASMFGFQNTRLHTVQVLVFSLLITLAMVTVADIDRPFQGTVHVSDAPFRRARIDMER
jgi:Protein of unknown function (DUF4239)